MPTETGPTPLDSPSWPPGLNCVAVISGFPKKLTHRSRFGLISFSARVEARAFISIVFVDGKSDTGARKGRLAEVVSSLPEDAAGPAR